MFAHTTDPAPPGPYGTHATTYHAHGWAPLPLPAGQKKHPPKGWTGYDGNTPSPADVHAWTETHPGGNIALRLPPDVLGLDVDAYDDKIGGPVLTELERTLGALPPTWRSTSRDDGTSGIRLFRIPPHLRWPTEAGPGIELIRHEHRYMVVWPSIHPNGGTYRWINPTGTVALADIPHVDDLPDLPEAWVQHYTRGEKAGEHLTAGMDDTAAHHWLNNTPAGHPCDAMARALDRALEDLTTSGARHDHMLRATNRLAWIAGAGHPGLQTALDTYQGAWLQAVAGDRGRDEAMGEWDRAVTGAADRAAAGTTRHHTDPCTDPFHGLIAQEPPRPTPAPPASTPPTPPPAPAAPSADTNPEADPELERTTWWPRTDDVEAALTGDQLEPPPTHLTRDDGAPCLYNGRVNGIIGPSESGKTWVALTAIAQAVNNGHRTTILDFEDTPAGVIGRLITLGLTPDQIRSHVAYIGPDEPFAPMSPTGRDLDEHLREWAPQLVVLDGYNAALTLQGWDLLDNTDVTRFNQRILKPLAGDDRTVVYIDHTPKATDHGTSGGIGAQAKRAMTSGCILRAEVIDPWGRGQAGKARLWVDKDRPGHVRGAAVAAKNGHHFADFNIEPVGEEMAATLTVPFGAEVEVTRKERNSRKRKRDIMAYMVDRPETKRIDIASVIGGKAELLSEALAELVDRKHLAVRKDESGAHLYTYLQPYDADLDDLLGPGVSGGGW